MSSKLGSEAFILNGLRQNVIRFLKESKISDNPVTVVPSESYDGNEGRDYTHVESLRGIIGFLTLKKANGEYTGYVEIDHAIVAKYKYEHTKWIILTA
jgi:hypothetical protein